MNADSELEFFRQRVAHLEMENEMLVQEIQTLEKQIEHLEMQIAGEDW